MQRWAYSMYLQRTGLNRRSCEMQKSEATSTPPYWSSHQIRVCFASSRMQYCPRTIRHFCDYAPRVFVSLTFRDLLSTTVTPIVSLQNRLLSPGSELFVPHRPSHIIQGACTSLFFDTAVGQRNNLWQGNPPYTRHFSTFASSTCKRITVRNFAFNALWHSIELHSETRIGQIKTQASSKRTHDDYRTLDWIYEDICPRPKSKQRNASYTLYSSRTSSTQNTQRWRSRKLARRI